MHDAASARLYEAGISGRGIIGDGHPLETIAIDEIERLHDDRFEFCRVAGYDGKHVAALVMACFNEFGDLHDLVAFSLRSGRIATYTGRASMLGAENCFRPRIDLETPTGKSPPLRVHATIAGWLRSGRDGVFIFRPQAAAPLLQLVGPLAVDCPVFARKLAEQLTIQPPQLVCRATHGSAAA
ncbi:hypothetical protein [Methylocystis parvus]|uniref:hypothetical protein n=1 Tax=Methylocystis parvus TaxID=134 RepID=UPI003C78AB0B